MFTERRLHNFNVADSPVYVTPKQFILTEFAYGSNGFISGNLLCYTIMTRLYLLCDILVCGFVYVLPELDRTTHQLGFAVSCS